ncbi:hypothetical protein I5Q34_19665 [Streptomyces sp. AV19]|uniref:hypothetical protein n=1 Tax=Streptomyces sp. AV19 TaxID=2793068 RepID=UPI0018FEF0EE|nr:hypothetical protein [Streptomyces sp. AV19]MBH1936466.1 hypothetical protein [Streptomyces sp. AV19]MDG4532522.1 hypothetical protein [Streptomyces sp. AV19]
MPARRHDPTRSAQTRLPWWAVVLPVLAFVALFVLLAAPAPAPAAEGAADGPGPPARIVLLVGHWASLL